MANYAISYALMRKKEGYYVNISSDLGGETYAGISRRWNPNFKGWHIIDAAKPLKRNQKVNSPELEKLISEFYLKYWNPIMGTKINSQAIADIFFDFNVLSGSAVLVMQRALNCTFGKKLVEDNEMGPATLAAINAVSPALLHEAFKKGRELFHRQRVAENPSQGVNLPGWLNRIHEFPDLIQKKKSSSIS